MTDLLFLPDTGDVQKLDWCLAQPDVNGTMQYYAASSCIADKKYLEKNIGPVDLPIDEIITDAYDTSKRYRSVLGVSKDGRPIYTPMHGGGKTYSDC